MVRRFTGGGGRIQIVAARCAFFLTVIQRNLGAAHRHYIYRQTDLDSKVQRTGTIAYTTLYSYISSIKSADGYSITKLNKMANTYTQLYIQYVFVVKSRQNLIPTAHKAEVYKYMTGVIQNRQHKLLAINGMPDHVHIFIGLHPAQSISKLAEEVKTATTKYINKQDWMAYKFTWQVGFGAFSYSRSHIKNVCKYIENQEAHHQKKSFKEEYIDFLEKFEVDYNEAYLFDFIDYDQD